MATKKTATRKYAKKEINTFPIEKNVEMGNLRGINNPMYTTLFNTVKNMPVSTKNPVFIGVKDGIPKTVGSAAAHCTKKMRESIKTFTLARKIVKDADQKVIGTRLWRIA